MDIGSEMLEPLRVLIFYVTGMAIRINANIDRARDRVGFALRTIVASRAANNATLRSAMRAEINATLRRNAHYSLSSLLATLITRHLIHIIKHTRDT